MFTGRSPDGHLAGRASYRQHPSRSLGKVPHVSQAQSSHPRGARPGPLHGRRGAVAANGRLPLIDRAATGKVDEYGGAARLRGDQSKVIAGSIKSGKAKNVILVIGDGMGDSEITVARNYLEGAGGAFPGIDALPLTGQMTHYSVNKDTGKPDYAPDSSATGTAWASGVKTYDNACRDRPQGQGVPHAAGAGEAVRAGHRRRQHLRDPGRHPRRAGEPHQPARLLRAGGDDGSLPGGGQGERWTRVRSASSFSTPART